MVSSVAGLLRGHVVEGSARARTVEHLNGAGNTAEEAGPLAMLCPDRPCPCPGGITVYAVWPAWSKPRYAWLSGWLKLSGRADGQSSAFTGLFIYGGASRL
jgi:hypothetical protein